MNTGTVTSWKDQLVKAAKADPKKAGILVILVVVMAVMWVRLMGGSSTGPARAAASPVSGSTETPSTSVGKPGSRDASAVTSLIEWSRRPIAPLPRNPFTINYDFFPQDGSKPATLRAPQGDGFWDQLAKSMTSRADQKKEREVLVENLRLQAAQLKVQSTVMGASPKALVNGELVGEGDVVASFRVIRIEARRIVVEREGIKLEIRFN